MVLAGNFFLQNSSMFATDGRVKNPTQLTAKKLHFVLKKSFKLMFCFSLVIQVKYVGFSNRLSELASDMVFS